MIESPSLEIQSLVRQRAFKALRERMTQWPPYAVAAAIEELPAEEQLVAFRVLPRKCATAVFEMLDVATEERLLHAMAQEDAAFLLNDMAPDDRTYLLEELPAEATKKLLALLSPQERKVASTLLGYPEDSIGRLMTPDYIAARQEWTIRQVLDFIRQHGKDSETLDVIYVVDTQGVLVDDIQIRSLLLNDPARPVTDLMDHQFIALKATDDQEVAVNVFRATDRTVLPVTDTQGILLGIVTVDDVLDVAEEEATTDIQKIGGTEALEAPYMQVPFFELVRKRAGWLVILFLSEMLTATAMGYFESEIEKAVVLALFVPLIMSSGGNSGSQASTLVIRALALEEVTLQDWWRVMHRELLMGLALGSILGLIGFLRITLWSGFSNLYGPHWFLIALTVGASLIGIVLWGTLAGSMMPFILRRLGFDPATSSAPFIATLVDVTGLVIYFSIGLVFLRGTLL